MTESEMKDNKSMMPKIRPQAHKKAAPCSNFQFIERNEIMSFKCEYTKVGKLSLTPVRIVGASRVGWIKFVVNVRLGWVGLGL